MVLLPINLANYNMKDKRILYVSSEVVPLAENEVSLMSMTYQR
jgi:hypothetical protein